MSISCSLYRSKDLVSDTTSTYIDYVRAAAAHGCEQEYRYEAISEGAKGIEPHIGLCLLTTSKDEPPMTENRSSGSDIAWPVSQATEDAT